MRHLFNFENQILDECDSTNLLAKEMAEKGAPHGTWVSARKQNNGKGRLGRKWESPEGNLFLSLIARIEKKSLWSWIPLAAATATVRASEELFQLPIQIKWPNDLWLNQAKIGGILCESSGIGIHSYIIIGIGLNWNQSPDGLDQPTESFSNALASQSDLLVSVDQMRQILISKIIKELEMLTTQGPTWIQVKYESCSVLPKGTDIQWGSPLQKGRVVGLGLSAELEVTNQAGDLIQLFAEEVKLLRKKL